MVVLVTWMHFEIDIHKQANNKREKEEDKQANKQKIIMQKKMNEWKTLLKGDKRLYPS